MRRAIRYSAAESGNIFQSAPVGIDVRYQLVQVVNEDSENQPSLESYNTHAYTPGRPAKKRPRKAPPSRPFLSFDGELWGKALVQNHLQYDPG